MKRLKLSVEGLRIESFVTAARSWPVGTVHGYASDTCYDATCTEVGETQCGTCNPESFGGTCQVFGCNSGACTWTCPTSPNATCNQTCIDCPTINVSQCTQDPSCNGHCSVEYTACC